MLESIIALIAMILIIVFDAFGDKIKFQWKKFIWRKDMDKYFWSPISWENKYKRDEYGFLLVDENGDYIRKTFKFIFTFTLPVIFTNGWHLVKAGKIFCILLPISILVSLTWGYWWLNQIIAILIWSILWEWLFNDLLEKES